MLRVTVEGQEREYPEGVSLRTAAEEFQPQFAHEILLAQVNGRLQELHKRIPDGAQIRFLTAQDRPGMQAYERSVVLLFLKAFYAVGGREHIRKVTVDFSLGDGLYMEPETDFPLTQDFLDEVKRRMQEYVKAHIPIQKRSANVDDALEQFHRHRMYDKERLFRYRRTSRVNLYSIEGFEDYFYGYMVQDTGYLRYFDLCLYADGLLLLLPVQKEPERVGKPERLEKLFGTLHEAEDWGRKLRVANVGELNDAISEGRMNELILIQEALMEKKIGDIAELIADRPDKKIVMIAGPSSSGKTTFANRLSVQLRAKGLIPHLISVDNYFVNRRDTPKDGNGNYNYEILEALDVKLFNENMTALLAGKTVELPVYNFVTGEREAKGIFMTLGENDILVIEGIHCLNDRLSYSLSRDNIFRIYISALTTLNIDEHNRIPTTDGRLIRRLVRDARTRGTSAQNTIRMWPSVRRGEEENIFPYQEQADVMFNSALVYELAVLKQYAEPLLFGVPRDSAEYTEAKRLLKFMDYFLGVGNEMTPQNSILREFTGGSCFQV